MFELGEFTHDEHKAIYDLLKDSNTHFYLVGNNFYNSVERDARVFQTKELFLDQVHLSTFENYHVLVKASRSMKLETIVELL